MISYLDPLQHSIAMVHWKCLIGRLGLDKLHSHHQTFPSAISHKVVLFPQSVVPVQEPVPDHSGVLHQTVIVYSFQGSMSGCACYGIPAECVEVKGAVGECFSDLWCGGTHSKREPVTNSWGS